MTERKAKTGPLARWLGCEERIENPTLNLLRNARSVVFNLDNDPPVLSARADGDFALAVHRIDGVVDQICPHLVKPAAVGAYSGHVLAVVAVNIDAALQLVAKD